jgi:hypothetical protein
MARTRLWIALDHQLEKWFIGGNGSSSRALMIARLSRMPRLGVVVRPVDVSRTTLADGRRLCVGLSDVADLNEISAALLPLDEHSHGSLATVKIGIYCDSRHSGAELVSRIIQNLPPMWRRLVLEPYCLDEKCLFQMHAATADHGCHVMWKLPIADEAQYEDFRSIFGN